MNELLVSSSPPIARGFGVVASARLDLTPIGLGSVEALAPIFAKEEVWRFPFGRAFTREETAGFATTQAEHWETLGFGLWLATVRSQDRPIGYVGLAVPTFLPEVLPAVEVGWRLDPEAWGMGYATEAAAVALRCAFETLALDELLSLPQVDNPRSVRVAERIGMHRQRTTTVPSTDHRDPIEVAVMAMTREEWGRRRAAAPGEPSSGGAVE